MFTKNTFKLVIYGPLALLLASCNLLHISSGPILIGFVGELTGAHGGLGVAARDGAQLAVSLINEEGGIKGRQVMLIIKDDKGDPDTARQISANLVDQGVVSIVGYTTSGQVAAVFEQMNAAKVVFISPAASSSQFSNQTDYFFRVVSSTDLLGKALATHMYNTRHVQHATCIYDLRNQAYAEPLWEAIQTQLKALGGSTGQAFTFTSGQTDLKALIAQVQATNPESLVFIASAVDTALLAQYGRQQGIEAPFFSSAWAQTNEFLEKGGRAVEGMEMIAGFNPQDTSPTFQKFAERFTERYGRSPGLMSSYAYEAVEVLAHALEQTGGRTEGLPEALVAIKDWPGVQGNLTMDAYGDIQRDVYIAVVKDGGFEIIDTISPNDQ